MGDYWGYLQNGSPLERELIEIEIDFFEDRKEVRKERESKERTE